MSLWDKLKEYVPSNAIIVEAGAHKGNDTIRMATMWPDAQIHTFEPVPALFDAVQKKVQSLSTVFCYPLALSNTVGQQSMHVSIGKCTAISSLHAPLFSYTSTHFTQCEVQTTTLDTWMQEYNIPRIDLLWLDVQGAEYDILQSSPRALQSIQLIHTEVNRTQRYADHPLYDEFNSWLSSQGYRRIAEDLYRIDWGNALFKRSI